jgi:hypothetical protein
LISVKTAVLAPIEARPGGDHCKAAMAKQEADAVSEVEGRRIGRFTGSRQD